MFRIRLGRIAPPRPAFDGDVSGIAIESNDAISRGSIIKYGWLFACLGRIADSVYRYFIAKAIVKFTGKTGVYFYRLKAGDFIGVKKLILQFSKNVYNFCNFV